MRSTLSRLAKEKGHQVRAMGVSSAVEHIVNEIAMQARTLASNRLAKANRASHGPRVRAKARVTKSANQGAKGMHKGKTSKTGISGLENLNSEASSETQESGHVGTTDTSWNDEWSFDEWNDDWIGVGWREDCEQTYDTSVSSFSLLCLDLGATSSPERFEWVKMNLDTGAAVNTFPLNFSPEGIGDGRLFEWIPDGGAWQFQGYDENGLLRSLNGRLTDAHQVLCSAAEIACKGRRDFYLDGHDGGYVIPIHSKIGKGMRIRFEKLVNWHGKNELIPVYLENNIFNFYWNREVKSTETNNVNDADHCLAKNC